MLVVLGNHPFFLIQSPAAPAILGFPWLVCHNPQIDWGTGSLAGWSVACHSLCLRSALPPASTSPRTPLMPADFFVVPEIYHNLGEVFSKQRATTLPPHRPYDCVITLLPGAPLSSSRLYSLSWSEREGMEGYLSELVAAGLIRLSLSPVGARFFFV